MNQYFHQLCTYSGMKLIGRTKKYDNIAAFVGITDSYRCWLERMETHTTLDSWWEIPHPEQLKNKQKEDLQHYMSDDAQKAKDEKWCVDGLTDFKQLVLHNKSLFSDKNLEKAGQPLLMHQLQDFYTDSVWRVLYNFHGQSDRILKTEGKVITGNEDIDGSYNSTINYPQYDLLETTLEQSNVRFRKEYKDLNEYATWLLISKLEGSNVESILGKAKRAYRKTYAREVSDISTKFLDLPDSIVNAMEGNTTELNQIQGNVKVILGENEHLYKQMIINSIKSVRESIEISKKLNKLFFHSKYKNTEKQLEKIFSKQLTIREVVEEYSKQVYEKFKNREQDDIER